MCDGMDGGEAAIFECVPPQDLVFGSMVEQVSATPSPMPSSNGDRRFLCCRLPQSVNEATKLYQQAIQAAVPAFERTVRRFSLLASAEQPRLSELPLQAFGLLTPRGGTARRHIRRVRRKRRCSVWPKIRHGICTAMLRRLTT